MATYTNPANKRGVPNPDELSVNRIHELLSNERRRWILDVIMDRAVVDKSELVDAVASIECDKPIEQLRSQERKRVHVSIHQCHIPALIESGVIVRENRQLTLGPNARRVHEYRRDTRSGGPISRLKKAIR